MVVLIRDLEKTLWNYLTLRNQKKRKTPADSVRSAYAGMPTRSGLSSRNVIGAARGADISAKSSGGLGYSVGDMVSHVKFGEGKVLAIEDSARDYMVTVEFAEYGQKKMLAGFARLKNYNDKCLTLCYNTFIKSVV